MHAKSIFNRQNLLYGLIFAIISTMSLGAFAQATNQAIYLPPGVSSQGAPPPPGDGMTPALVTPGDSQWQGVPSGRITSSPQTGTNLGTQNPKRRPRINLMMNGLVVATIQPDNLTNQQKGAVQGIIGGGGGAPYQNVNVSVGQLKQIQAILAPYPATGTSAVPMPTITKRRTSTQRNQIFSDTPSPNALKHGTNGVVPMLPVVRQFCRYLVILGAVCACLFMAFSAISWQFGDRNAPGRIIGSAAGIMLLFMGYAIWKVVRYNENNARGPEVVDLSSPPPMQQSRSSPGDVNQSKSDDSFASTTNANLPVTPANPGGIQRSGLPLQPLGAAH